MTTATKTYDDATTYTLVLVYDKSGRKSTVECESPAAAHAVAGKRAPARCTLYSNTWQGSRVIETFRN